LFGFVIYLFLYLHEQYLTTMNFKGYREVNVPELEIKLLSAFGKSELSRVDIASKLKTSSQTIDNAFLTVLSTREGCVTFKASDRIVCQVANALGLSLAIVETGQKRYYIKNGK